MASNILTKAEVEKFKGHDFGFENLVLEGGGAKLVGAVGAIQVLEELEILPKIKRFAGTSAGALTAALLSVGYTGNEVQELVGTNFAAIIRDEGWFKFIAWPKNFFDIFAVHRGETLHEWLHERLTDKMGKRNATFKEVFDKTKKELLITATDLVVKETVYFHVKTTPNFPVWRAILMSMSIPGFLPPYMTTDGRVLVDGGVLCNYPLFCFDGWFLSLDEDNSFDIKKREHGKDLWNDDYRFKGRNEKTLGLLVYSQDEDEIFKEELEQRVFKYVAETKGEVPALPDTKMRRESQLELEGQDEEDGPKAEGQIEEMRGHKFPGGALYKQRKIKNVTDYLYAAVSVFDIPMKKQYTTKEDLHRTIGVNTAYLDTLDFEMEDEDKEFLRQQSKIACLAFLDDRMKNSKK